MPVERPKLSAINSGDLTSYRIDTNKKAKVEAAQTNCFDLLFFDINTFLQAFKVQFYTFLHTFGGHFRTFLQISVRLFDFIACLCATVFAAAFLSSLLSPLLSPLLPIVSNKGIQS